MKPFFKNAGIVIVLMIIGPIFAFNTPKIGLFIGLAFVALPLFALIKPLPKIYLGHRLFSALIALLVGAPTALASLGVMSDTNRLAELRKTSPTVYLAELEDKNQELWLTELKILAPDRHAEEMASVAAAEAIREAEEDTRKAEAAAEQERVEDARRAEATARRDAEENTKIIAYIEQLDREIAAMPNAHASTYTEDVASINVGLLVIGAWSLLYEEGEDLNLSAEAQQKRQQFRRLLVQKQTQLFPALRDAYGPAMRQQLWEADGSARTIGSGYRTVEFVSAAFARNANIQQIHLEVRENLMMLRFTRAQYKWFQQASEFSYYTLEVPQDSDIANWGRNGSYTILD